MKICCEEKLIIKILFSKKEIVKTDFININYEKFLKISSNHLIIPSIYLNLLNKKKLSYLPKDLAEYFKEIFNANRTRNKFLIKEAKELSTQLNKNNFKHFFIKGIALISLNIYDDIGARMIGDIDFYFEKEKAIKIKSYLKKIGYQVKNTSEVFSMSRHIKRHVHKKKIAAIEPHFRLISKNSIEKTILNEMKIYNGKFVPNPKNLLLINIYNHQINDFGNIRLFYNYRNIYDTFMIIKKYRYKYLKDNQYLRNYFYLINKLGIEIKIKIEKPSKFYRLRLYFKYFNKLSYIIDSLLSKTILNINLNIYKFIEFLKNINYRKKVINKIYTKIRLKFFFG